MWSIITSIFFGALAGWIASLIMKTDSQQGFWLDVLVGIIGANLGKWLFSLMHFSLGAGFWGDLGTSVIGACLLLFLVKLFSSMTRR